MNRSAETLSHHSSDIVDFIAEIDKDVERGEDIVMAGLCLVMMSTFFAPVAPPPVLLPIVAVVFAISASLANLNYRKIERKIIESAPTINESERAFMLPIQRILKEFPSEPLSLAFNPLRNIKRCVKSAIGGLLINPLWMPIFYMMGMQINEEKKLIVLNRTIQNMMQKLSKESSALACDD